MIVRPRTDADVAAAVTSARETGTPHAVRSGGHSSAAHGSGDGSRVTDLRKMIALDVDLAAGTVLQGELDLRGGLTLPTERRHTWEARIDEAEAATPVDFPQNGWAVHAFQAAWSAIATTPVPDDVAALHLRDATEAAVRCGGDTDTVAAIAGSLLGARWGASALPAEWRDVVHGWPGLGAVELAERGRELAEAAARTP